MKPAHAFASLGSIGPAIFLLACSAGAPARAIRPDAPTAAGALGDKCNGGAAAPLVVDWSPDRRAELESALGRSEILVVRYKCPEVEILPRCGIAYGYAYEPVSRREEVLRIADEDSLRATLPTLAAGPLLPRASAELARGSSLDLGLVLTGRLRAKQPAVHRPDVSPACSQATHYVSAASLGAFALSVGTRAHVRSAVEIFASVEASSASSQQLTSKDGRIDACASTSEETRGPRDCRSPLRIELRPLDPRFAEQARCEDEKSDAACIKWADRVGSIEPPNRELLEAPARRVLDLCRGGNPEGCRAARQLTFAGVADITRAEIEELTCRAGDPSACGYVADRQLAAGKGVEAFRTRETACLIARSKKRYGDACGSFADQIAAGEGPEPPEGRAQLALDLHAFACVNGWPSSCSKIGPLFARGLRARGELAGASLVEDCFKDSAMHCQPAAAVLAYGLGVRRDVNRARAAWNRDCTEQRKHGALSCLPFPY